MTLTASPNFPTFSQTSNLSSEGWDSHILFEFSHILSEPLAFFPYCENFTQWKSHCALDTSSTSSPPPLSHLLHSNFSVLLFFLWSCPAFTPLTPASTLYSLGQECSYSQFLPPIFEQVTLNYPVVFLFKLVLITILLDLNQIPLFYPFLSHSLKNTYTSISVITFRDFV